MPNPKWLVSLKKNTCEETETHKDNAAAAAAAGSFQSCLTLVTSKAEIRVV